LKANGIRADESRERPGDVFVTRVTRRSGHGVDR
jgi:hypothetical protein